MSKGLLIGVAIGVVAAGVLVGGGVGIGAAIWSGDSSTSSPTRGFSQPTKVGSGLYQDDFTVVAKWKGLRFAPDYGPSDCAVPGEIKETGSYIGGFGYEYKGTAAINDSGSCYWTSSYAYWTVKDARGFALSHQGGSYGCKQACTTRAPYTMWFIYTN
jgi:hypothetical protein